MRSRSENISGDKLEFIVDITHVVEESSNKYE